MLILYNKKKICMKKSNFKKLNLSLKILLSYFSPWYFSTKFEIKRNHLLFEIISIESTFPIHSPPPPPINNNTSDNSSLRYQIKFSPILNVNFLLKKRKEKKIDTDNEGGEQKKRNPCLSIFIQFFSEKKHERQRKREKKREIYASYYFQKSCLPAIIRSMGR